MTDTPRILFVADGVSPGNASGTYNGGGWISSLLSLAPRLNIAFRVADLPPREPSRLEKIRKYYFGKEFDNSPLREKLRGEIAAFRPDLIYLFGLENRISEPLLDVADVPVAVHLQGLLKPIAAAYFPPGFSQRTFLSKFSVREHLLRNGFVYAYREMCRGASREDALIRKADIFLGRTAFDRDRILSAHPEARYFKLDEILREPFYAAAGTAVYRQESRLRIVSTLSETVYKGLDLVLRTAARLRSQGIRDWQWDVIGLAASSRMVPIFERTLGIRSEEVGVRYLGVQNAEAVCRTLLGSDVYVHPSYIDNSPNSVCEAQMLGVPVVATAVGGVGSLIADGETGILVPAGDDKALADALLSLSKEPHLRESLGKAGCAAARKRHDKETVLRDLGNIIAQCCNR